MLQNAKTTMQNARTSRLRPIVAATFLIFWMLTSGATSARSEKNSSIESARTTTESAADSSQICFSEAQADSILSLIDTQDYTIKQLRVDVWEMKQYAALDSTWAAYERERYDVLLKSRDNWFERLYKHPMLWFVLGTYLGVRAGDVN